MVYEPDVEEEMLFDPKEVPTLQETALTQVWALAPHHSMSTEEL